MGWLPHSLNGIAMCQDSGLQGHLAERTGIGWNLGDNLTDLNMAAKEWVGIRAYRLTGRARPFNRSLLDAR